jgi:hypothetical protein
MVESTLDGRGSVGHTVDTTACSPPVTAESAVAGSRSEAGRR